MSSNDDSVKVDGVTRLYKIKYSRRENEGKYFQMRYERVEENDEIVGEEVSQRKNGYKLLLLLGEL